MILYPSTIKIVPLSVNAAWKGRRFKTQEYKNYEKELLFTLPKILIPKPPYRIYLEFGMSNAASDFDNPTKQFVDILSKKYKFNDKDIYEAHIKKVVVPKGQEYITFEISPL